MRSKLSLISGRPSNPKRHSDKNRGRGAWFNYYAGYSADFVVDVLDQIAEPGCRVMDPWNGAGTTTQVAVEQGFGAVGYDANPVMVVVAKARLLGPEVSPSESAIARQIVDLASKDVEEAAADDPLLRWFTPRPASDLRRIAVAIEHLLVGESRLRKGQQLSELGSVSCLASFFFVALFRTVREFLNPFRSSNPTWMRTRISPSQRVRPSFDRIVSSFEAHVCSMAAAHLRPGFSYPDGKESVRVEIAVADSTRLPCENGSVDLVVTSPPYCTRIDYAMATLPELSVLGFGAPSVRNLRNVLIGSATINNDLTLPPDQHFGSECEKLLTRVESHESYAAASYYHKQLLQYFGGLQQSVTQIDRALADGGNGVFVVQDSYFKDIRVDLAGILTEIGEACSWELVGKFDFASKRNIARINSRAVERSAIPVESILHFRKPA